MKHSGFYHFRRNFHTIILSLFQKKLTNAVTAAVNEFFVTGDLFSIIIKKTGAYKNMKIGDTIEKMLHKRADADGFQTE